VSGDNNSGVPFNTNNTIEKYKAYLEKLGLIVDEETLSKSRRCAKEICAFVSMKTGIQLEAQDEKKSGIVKEITDREELIKLLKDDSIMKILYQNAHKQYFKAINWGNSKGDTYDTTLVVLTGSLDGLFSDGYTFDSEKTKNKLYVALTRTKGDLFIVKKDLFEEFDKKQFKVLYSKLNIYHVLSIFYIN
jgi:DNA helicase-2/ATP-dependent DNA helicase PcrA